MELFKKDINGRMPSIPRLILTPGYNPRKKVIVIVF
jgi:hypothetical protein